MTIRISVSLILASVAGACTSSEAAVENTGAGSAGGSCYGNGTCDAGLLCDANLCVQPELGVKGGRCYGNGTCNVGLLCTGNLCVEDPSNPIFAGKDGVTTSDSDENDTSAEDTTEDTGDDVVEAPDTTGGLDSCNVGEDGCGGSAKCSHTASGSFSTLKDGDSVESSGTEVVGTASDDDGVGKVIVSVDASPGCTFSQNYSGDGLTVVFSIPVNFASCGILSGTHDIHVYVEDICPTVGEPVLVASVSVEVVTPCGSCPPCTSCSKGSSSCVPDVKLLGTACGTCHACDGAGACNTVTDGTPCDGGLTCQTGACVETTSCGDGTKDADEECDKSDFGGASCQGKGYDGGFLTCEPAKCEIGTLGCCDDACVSGATQCVANQVSTCTSQGACLGWSAPVACSNGCNGDVCAPPVVDECGKVTWVARKSLTEPDPTIISAAFDGVIHVLGWSFYKHHRIYTPSNDSWALMNDLPGDCAEGALVPAGGELYAFGTGTFDANHAYRWNDADDTWATLAANPYPRRLPASGEIGGKIYLAGAFAGSDKVVNMYDPGNNTWKDLAPLSTDLGGMAHAVVAGKMYAFGGHGDASAALMYDPGANSWTPLPSIPQSRYLAQAVVIAGRIWLLAGRNGSNQGTDTIYVFDPTSKVWCEGPAMPEKVYGFAASQIDNTIYVIGGHVPSGNFDVYTDHVWAGTAE